MEVKYNIWSSSVWHEDDDEREQDMIDPTGWQGGGDPPTQQTHS